MSLGILESHLVAARREADVNEMPMLVGLCLVRLLDFLAFDDDRILDQFFSVYANRSPLNATGLRHKGYRAKKQHKCKFPYETFSNRCRSHKILLYHQDHFNLCMECAQLFSTF